jgi:tetratricopeptide (TPR) repeat protein
MPDIMRGMRLGNWLLLLVSVTLMAACSLQGAPKGSPQGAQAPGSAQPPTPAPEQPGAPAAATSERPPAAPPRQFSLGPASTALVAQAHRQAGGGDYGQAAATIERALRIEPDNPLLWIELGRVRMGENNPAQADSMGRKALSLATGDPAAEASAWRLIADSLRARGKNPEATEADQRAAALAPR